LKRKKRQIKKKKMADEIKKNKDCLKVLFQSTNPQLFRTTSIGYLYEIAQRHRVVLLAEEIDSYTKKILCDRNLFPGLGKIIFFEPPFYGDILRKNYRLCRKSKKVVRDYKPDIVVTPEDIWPMSLYLLRFAKKEGIATLALQDGFRIAESKKLCLWSCLTNSYLRTPGFLPFSLRMFFVKMKKYLGHLLYYWILPLTSGQLPFLGKTSFAFWDISPGLRDADWSAVFSARDYDLSLKDGVSPEKLFILGHPLERALTRSFFEKAYFSGGDPKEGKNIATIMWPGENLEFYRQDYSLIPEKQVLASRLKAVRLITEKLTGWKVFIKPHPSLGDVAGIKNLLAEVPGDISVVEPTEPADKYIAMSKVIVGFPLPSTTLFTASLQHHGKIILSLNLNQAFLGDAYKNFEGIEYIDSEDKLIGALFAIKDNKYKRRQKMKSKTRSFSSAAELLGRITKLQPLKI